MAVLLAALINLSHPAHTVDWHWFSMPLANVIVLVLMIVVFIAAILLPFPGRGKES